MTEKDTPPADQIIPQPPETATLQVRGDEPRQRGSGCLWGIAGMIGCSALVVLVLVVLVLLGVTSVTSVIGSLGNLFGAGTPPRATVVSSQTIVEGIQPLGQLVSVSAQVAKADVLVKVNQGPLNTCGFSADHVVQGAVEAGIDLTQIGPGDLTYDSTRDTYVLTVPAPQLTSCRVDYIRQYDRSFTTCSIDWDEARLLANYMALTQFRDDAIEGGILTRAQEQTKLVLGNFVRLLTGHPVEIVFQQPQATVVPPSCQPDLPQGWQYSPDANLWYK